MAECTHDCGSCGEDCARRDMHKAPHELSKIKKVIGVVSGKGGVGKSLTTAMLAVTAQRNGFKAAILDADITGPSIPKMFGITDKAMGTDMGILPAMSKTGIEIMSMNLLLEEDTDPVIWRGPIIAGTVLQFWTDVIWNDVDYMFVDMPPGTGDVPLSIYQSVPLDGIIVVTTPQELVSMIVKKSGRDGGENEYSGFGRRGKHELCPVPRLRQKNRDIRQEPCGGNGKAVRRKGFRAYSVRRCADDLCGPRIDRTVRRGLCGRAFRANRVNSGNGELFLITCKKNRAVARFF